MSNTEVHHSDVQATEADRARGEELAAELGDLFFDYSCSPALQWTDIVKALRLNGMVIVKGKAVRDGQG